MLVYAVPKASLEALGQKNLFLLPKVEPRSLARLSLNPVTILTMLSRAQGL